MFFAAARSGRPIGASGFRGTFLVGLTAFVLAPCAPAPALAQQSALFDTEIALDVRSPQIADVTDDGALAAVVVRTRRSRGQVDHARYGDPTYVGPSLAMAMIVDTRSGTRTWLHQEPAQVSDLTFSPDGSRLAYFLYDGTRFTLRVHDVARGTTREVPLRSGRPIASTSPLVWSPDGSRILLSLRPDGWAARAREAFYGLTEAPVIVQDSRNDFLAWDRVRNIADEQITALVTLSDGSVRELLTDVVPQDPDFTADGSTLTYGTTVRTKTSYTRQDGADYGLYALRLADGAVTELVPPAEDRLTVTWNEARDAYAYADDGAVFVRALTDAEARDVTEGHRSEAGDTTKVPFSVERWSPSGSGLLLTSPDGWHLADVQAGTLRQLLALEEDESARPRRSVQGWSGDGRHVFFTYSARDHWERGLKRLDVETGAMADIVLDEGVYGDWSVSDDGRVVVYTRSDGDRPDDVWAKVDGAAATRLTDLNPQLADVSLSRTELVEYLDVDGNTLYGILYYPIGYDAGRRYPLVAEVYEEFFDNGFNENMNLVTSRGWFGFRPSVRFEEGYPGEAWLKAVPNAINKLIERGLVDADRVGVYGQSYGGYAVNLLITQTDRFAAAANVSGKVNIISFLGDSPKITTRNYAAAEVGQDRIGATLWEQPHKYIATSAVMFADRIETPLLMLSGEGDWNVPATNQREMYYALRRLGKEVVWVHYTAGGHGAGRASTVADFHDHWRRLLDWFDEHFEDDGATATTEQGGR